MAVPKKIDINVEMTRNPNGSPPLLFAINHSLKFDNDHHPGFEIQFDLIDKDSTGYVFPDDPRQAMWVQPIDPATPGSCPTAPVYWEQFAATTVTNSNRTLTVIDPNQYKQQFAFTLRVTKTPSDANATFVDYDPIGSNGNGKVSRNNLALVVAVVAVAAVVAVVAVKLLSGA